VKYYTRIAVPLGLDEFNALQEHSRREYRHPREQARFMLRAALGLDPEIKVNSRKHSSAEQVLADPGAAE
jgi:hypothetical protein